MPQSFYINNILNIQLKINHIKISFSFCVVTKHINTHTQEAHPMRLINVHFINVPSFINQIMAIIRPFVRKEVEKLIRFHKAGADTLYEYVPKELLPAEYGGSTSTVEEIRKEWREKIESNRDYLIDKNNWLLKNFENNKSANECSPTDKITSRFDDMGFD